MKKILRRLFLIIIVSLIFCFSKQNNVYGVGFVYQAWAEDGGTLYFRTFTAPLPATVDAYLHEYVKTGTALRTNASPNGKFTYTYTDDSNKKVTLSGTSMWAMGSSNSYFKVSNPTYGAFATRKIVFHTDRIAEYGNIDDTNIRTFRYSKLGSSVSIGDKLNDISNIYGSTDVGGTTTANGISINSSTIKNMLLTGDAEETLYRMTILAPGSTGNAIYVADRKFTSSQISDIKGTNDNNLGTIEGHARAIYVSQYLGFAANQAAEDSKTWTIATNPKEFITEYKSKYRMGRGN